MLASLPPPHLAAPFTSPQPPFNSLIPSWSSSSSFFHHLFIFLWSETTCEQLKLSLLTNKRAFPPHFSLLHQIYKKNRPFLTSTTHPFRLFSNKVANLDIAALTCCDNLRLVWLVGDDNGRISSNPIWWWDSKEVLGQVQKRIFVCSLYSFYRLFGIWDFRFKIISSLYLSRCLLSSSFCSRVRPPFPPSLYYIAIY